MVALKNFIVKTALSGRPVVT